MPDRPSIATSNYGAAAYRDSGHYHDACQAYLDVWRRSRDSGSDVATTEADDALLNIGAALRLAGRTGASSSIYDRVLRDGAQDDASTLVARYNKAESAAAGGRAEEAIEAFTEVVERIDRGAEVPAATYAAAALSQRGMSFLYGHRLEEGLRDLDEVAARYASSADAELQSRTAIAIYHKGIALRDAGRSNEAITAFSYVVTHFGSSTQASVVLWATMAQYEKAIELIRTGDASAAADAVDEFGRLAAVRPSPHMRRRLAKVRYARARRLFHEEDYPAASRAFRDIEVSFAPDEGPVVEGVRLASRRHDLFMIAAVDATPDAGRAVALLDPSIRDAIIDAGAQVAAIINVVHPDGTFRKAEEGQSPSPLSKEAVEALGRAEQGMRDAQLKLVREQVELDLQSHYRAADLLLEYLKFGKPFALLLRDFARESFWVDGTDGDPPHPVRINIQLAKQSTIERAIAGTLAEKLPCLAVASPTPLRSDFEHVLPRLLLPNEHWTSVVEELIRAAAIIFVDVGGLTPGVIEELGIVERLGRQSDTVVMIVERQWMPPLGPSLALYGAKLPEVVPPRRDCPELTSFPYVRTDTEMSNSQQSLDRLWPLEWAVEIAKRGAEARAHWDGVFF